MIKVGIDVGGVLSKRPEVWRVLVAAMAASPDIEVHVLSDMISADIVRFCKDNGFVVPDERYHHCDYNQHGEKCKAVKAVELGLDVLVDDHMGYLMEGDHVRLLVMPDTSRPYYADEWLADAKYAPFARVKPKTDV